MFMPIMQGVANSLVKQIEASKGQNLDLQTLLDPATIKIILQTHFGLDKHSYEAVGVTPKALRAITQYFFYMVRNPFVAWTPIRVLYERYSGLGKVVKKVNSIPKSLVDRRVKVLNEKKDKTHQSSDRKIFIDILFQKYIENELSSDSYRFDEKGLSEEINTMFGAGFDTTSTAIMWTLYCLGWEQEVQEKLYEEVSCMRITEETATFDYIKNYLYLDQVVKEGLRIRPTVPLVLRELACDFTYKGYTVPKGSQVFLPILCAHLDPEIYAEPNKFDPDRFSSESAERPSKAFIPFAVGPRQCIGKNFAILEMKIIVATIIKHFKIVSPKPVESIEYDFDIVSFPKEPLEVRFCPRN